MISLMSESPTILEFRNSNGSALVFVDLQGAAAVFFRMAAAAFPLLLAPCVAVPVLLLSCDDDVWVFGTSMLFRTFPVLLLSCDDDVGVFGVLEKWNMSFHNGHYGLLCDIFSFRNCISNPRLSSNEILYASFFCNGIRETRKSPLHICMQHSCNNISWRAKRDWWWISPRFPPLTQKRDNQSIFLFEITQCRTQITGEWGRHTRCDIDREVS